MSSNGAPGGKLDGAGDLETLGGAEHNLSSIENILGSSGRCVVPFPIMKVCETSLLVFLPKLS